MKRAIVLVVVLGCLVGCSKQHDVEPQTQGQESLRASQPTNEQQESLDIREAVEQEENLDICEAVFRYQFEHNASGAQQKAEAYFLSVFKKDPSPDFLARFMGHKPPVKRGSEFEIGKGLAFRVDRIRRVNQARVEVSGGYYEDVLSSSGNIYVVEKTEGKWTVTKNTMAWIS